MHLMRLSKLSPGIDITDCQPFVFGLSGNDIRDIPRTNNKVLAAPFPFFSIEIDQGNLTGGTSDGVTLKCLLCRELKPDQYDLTILVGMNTDLRVISITRNDGAYTDLLDLIHIYLNRLYDEKNYDTKFGGKARYKNIKGRTCSYKPTNVIYVTGQKFEGVCQRSDGGGIKLRQSWAVRSHWRTLSNPEAIGIDRMNERTVKGSTWIGTYYKGEGKLTTKVRKVR